MDMIGKSEACLSRWERVVVDHMEIKKGQHNRPLFARPFRPFLPSHAPSQEIRESPSPKRKGRSIGYPAFGCRGASVRDDMDLSRYRGVACKISNLILSPRVVCNALAEIHKGYLTLPQPHLRD